MIPGSELSGAAWKLGAHPWALHASGQPRVEEMARVLSKAKGQAPAHRSALKAEMRPGGIARLPIVGVLAKDASWWPDTAYDEIIGAARALREDPNVAGVLLDIDSPGGSTLGALEAAGEIAALAGEKHVLAYTDQMMASAAYFLAAGAGAIGSSMTAYTGSIGTFTFFADMSGWLADAGVRVEAFHDREGDLKTTWLPWTSLTDDQRAAIQEAVEKSHAKFEGHVAAHRQLAPGTMRGQVFLGDEARDRGAIDFIGSRADAEAALLEMVRG